MKGIVLAGGKGTRLDPLTRVCSKQLLPVYNQPMFFYPLRQMQRAGISEVLLIVAPDQEQLFRKALGDGPAGMEVELATQAQPNGIAEALIIGENFVGNDNVVLMLGDNLFDFDFMNSVIEFESGAHVFVKSVSTKEARSFGVALLNENKTRIEQLVEKPVNPPPHPLVLTGAYIFDNRAAQFAHEVQPSARGELEIVDVLARYLSLDELYHTEFHGRWMDAGTPDALLSAGCWAKEANQTLILK